MRIVFTILLLFFSVSQLQSQTQKASYLGQSSWRKVATQKKPDTLLYEKTSFPMKTTAFSDSLDNIFSRKVDPGTVTLKIGATVPVTEPLKFMGKKLAAPQSTQATPLQIRDNAQFNIHYTDKKHGFPALYAHDFAEDEENNIWIATERGVINYDGYYYHYYKQPDNIPELQESSILYDHQKRLWVASSNGLYFIKNDSAFTIQHSEIDFTGLDCKEVLIDQFQRIWIPTKSYGAICIDGNTVKVYDKRCGLPNNFVEAMYVDKKGNLLMASREHGIIMIEPDKMRMFFSNSKNIVFHNFLAFYEDQNGIWASCYGAGLFRLSTTDTLQYSFSGRYNEVILDMKKAPKGIWISCYGKAVFYLSDNNFLRINETNGLLNNVPMRIFLDHFENVWVSNIAGFSRINDNSFYLGRFNNKAISHTNEIIPDSKRKGEWLITFGKGLLFKKENKITAYTHTTSYGAYRFDHLTGGVLNKDGSIWTTAYGEGIIRFTENKFTLYKYSDFTDNLILFSTKSDANNKVWFCPNRFGLIMYDKERFWHYTKKSGLLSENALNVFVDQNKTVNWTFVQGVQRFKNESIETFYINGQPFKDKVNKMISLDEKRMLWGTDNNGLMLLDGDQVFQFTKANGLLSNTINLLIKDKFGKIWITSEKGIESFEIRDGALHNHLTFNKANGPYLLDAVDVFIDTTGLPYWVIGDRKMTFNPNLMHDKNKKPSIRFKEIIIDNETFTTNTNFKTLPNQKITINYKTIYWGNENNLQLNYLLIANKKDTIERSVQNNGSIFISDILPGNYKVLLKATNNNDIYYSNPITITVQNFWYNSWLFRITMGSFIVISIIAYFKNKARRQSKINEELKRKVQEQTKEIEKEKEALLLSYQTIDLQNKEKDVLIDEINHRVKNNLQFISAILEMQVGNQYSREVIEALLGTSRRIKAMSLVHELLNNKYTEKGISIRTYIQELVDNLKEMADNNIQPVQIDLNVDPISLDPKKVLPIGIIISELVSNSYKYAFKDIAEPRIIISLKNGDPNRPIILTVEDNGKGYSADIKPSSGLGRRLIDIFSRQLEANYEVENDGKFKFQLYITNTKHS